MKTQWQFLLALLMWCASGLAHGGGIFTVITVGSGNDAACDFFNLQTALNSASTNPADATEIRLSADVSNVGLQITDRNITLRGNWLNCAAAQPSPLIRREIAGGFVDSVIRTTTTGLTARSVILRSVIVRGGGADNASERGGGVQVQGRVALTLANVVVSNNASIRGGGIAIEGAFASAEVESSSVIGNSPSMGLIANGAFQLGAEIGLGGGIYCVGGQLALASAIVRGNTSTHHGGGIYLDNCDVLIEASNNPILVTPFQVRDNIAFNGNGGGIHATNGSTIFWRSVPAGASAGLVINNRASARGGALFIDGASDFVADWVRFVGNRADERGGTLAADENANVILRGGAEMTCNAASNCPGIFSSRGITEGNAATLIGGAIYAAGGAQLSLRQQHLYDNFANNGSAIHLTGNATSASLNGVLIARNVLYGAGNGTSTIELTSSADAVLRHVTMAGNFRVSNVFPGIERALSSVRANGSQSTLELRNSSFFDDANVLLRLLVSASASGSCVLAHESLSFAPALVLNPNYVNTLGEFPDYSLSDTSPARDRCAASGVLEVDVLGRARPLDLFAVANLAGAFDVGAFESFSTDDIFRDGFELP